MSDTNTPYSHQATALPRDRRPSAFSHGACSYAEGFLAGGFLHRRKSDLAGGEKCHSEEEEKRVRVKKRKSHSSKEVLKALEDREYQRKRKTERKHYFRWQFHYICLTAFFFAAWFLCFYGLLRLAQIHMR